MRPGGDFLRRRDIIGYEARQNQIDNIAGTVPYATRRCQKRDILYHTKQHHIAWFDGGAVANHGTASSNQPARDRLIDPHHRCLREGDDERAFLCDEPKRTDDVIMIEGGVTGCGYGRTEALEPLTERWQMALGYPLMRGRSTNYQKTDAVSHKREDPHDCTRCGGQVCAGDRKWQYLDRSDAFTGAHHNPIKERRHGLCRQYVRVVERATIDAEHTINEGMHVCTSVMCSGYTNSRTDIGARDMCGCTVFVDFVGFCDDHIDRCDSCLGATLGIVRSEAMPFGDEALALDITDIGSGNHPNCLRRATGQVAHSAT
jgi:hypothetical protein